MNRRISKVLVSEQTARHPELCFQRMAGATWLKLVLVHVPDQGEQVVRYHGWQSNPHGG